MKNSKRYYNIYIKDKNHKNKTENKFKSFIYKYILSDLPTAI